MGPIDRRDFNKALGLGAAALALPGCTLTGGRPESKPNIIYILADDLGYGEVGCYGQEKIKTPSIDRIAANGVRFTQHYSGNTVCAPSRCALLTGKHMGHAYIRGNDEMKERGDVWNDPAIEGQRPLPAGTETIATMLKRAGYATGAMGKWGLGGPSDSGHPNDQGFDEWYGYLCQREAHSYYPTHLWRNKEKHVLEANRDGAQGDYSHDLIADEALGFIRRNHDRPFFLYVPFCIPHVSLQVPEDSLAEYAGLWPETPFKGGHYAGHATPRAAYAAMVTRMDRDVGRILDLIEELGIGDNTLVVFTSDNGPTFNGGSDSPFFKSAGPFRGLKCSLYEGGIRVPFVAQWPGRIAPGTTSDHLSAFWDMMPTVAEMAGVSAPDDVDGLSMLPTLLGRADRQEDHDYLYWELRGSQAARRGDWKAVRLKGKKKIELYNLSDDPGETHNVADDFPAISASMAELFHTARTDSEFFPL